MNVIYTQTELADRTGRSRWDWVRALSDEDVQTAAEADGVLKLSAPKVIHGRVYRRFSDLERFFPRDNHLADRFIDHLKKHPGSVEITTDEVMVLMRGNQNDADAG